MVKECKKKLRKSLSKEEYEYVLNYLEPLNKYCPTIHKGDTYSIEYFPEQGIEFVFNGEPINKIEDKRLGDLLFSTWIGPKSMDKKMPRELLGLNK